MEEKTKKKNTKRKVAKKKAKKKKTTKKKVVKKKAPIIKKSAKMFNGKNDYENGVITALKLGLASIGPEEILIKEHEPLLFKPKVTLYDFKDNLKYNFEMLYFVRSRFNRMVIGENTRYKKLSNDNYGIALCEKIIRKVADRILDREENICENLNKYLSQDDVDFAFEYIKECLKENFDTYTVTILTDLLSLEGIENIKIANLTFSSLLEDEKDIYKSASSMGMYDFLNGVFWAKDEADNLVTIKITQKGLHFENETSLVFENALSDFKTFFSYLLLCEFKLQKLRDDKFEINSEYLSYDSSSNRTSKGIQKYYVEKADSSIIMSLNTKYLDPHISNKKITLNGDALDRIEKDCALEGYKKVFKEKETNEVAKKIIRAMDWSLQANLEDDMTDSVIKYFIALESLFSTGGSGLNSKTICDNIAMFCDYEIKGRLDWTKKFSELLRWRNKIVHHGGVFEDNPKGWRDLNLLKIGVSWSIIGTISIYDKICTLGAGGDSINKYFNDKRLAANIY